MDIEIIQMYAEGKSTVEPQTKDDYSLLHQ
jgi:hypothetical protein